MHKLRRPPVPPRPKSTATAKAKAKVDAASTTRSGEAGATQDDDAVDPDPAARRWRGFTAAMKSAQVTSKQTATTSSWLSPFGLEVAVKVNHVDPLSEGRDEVKLQWIAGGDGSGADLENTIHRRSLGGGRRFDLQGPALSARPDGGSGLPLRARFMGVAWSQQIEGQSPGDPSPPRAELKVEVKLTDRGVAQLAALAGSTLELNAILGDSGVAEVVGAVLMGAVPVVGGAIAVCSARRATQVVRDKTSTKGQRALAVLRAVADALLIVNPAVSAAMNVGLVLYTAGAALVKRRSAKRAVDEGP